MIENVKTAMACSRLLLQLVGIKVTEDVIQHSSQSSDLDSSQDISTSLTKLSKTYNVKLRQKRLVYNKLTIKNLPLIFLTNDGEYIVLAKMDQDNALVQHPFKSNTELWSREQLCHQWSGAVIILSTASLKFNISWFVLVFWQYRYILAEILLFSQYYSYWD